MGGSVGGSVDRGSVFCRNPEKSSQICENAIFYIGRPFIQLFCLNGYQSHTYIRIL